MVERCGVKAIVLFLRTWPPTKEYELEGDGYTATRHQREVGAGYFDMVLRVVSRDSSTLALSGSTEEGQFR